MTTHAERVEIVCPQCGRTFSGWCRPGAMVLGGDDHGLHLELATSSVCRHCGTVVRHHELLLTREGTWVQDPDRTSAP
jgi:predicted RNA-binding Zn-ribbon protein involved in translation (DUF1610 family)